MWRNPSLFYRAKFIENYCAKIIFDISIEKSFLIDLLTTNVVITVNFKGALSGLRQFLVIESPLRMMKNAFDSPQKLFSFSRYLSFCLDFLVM